MKLFKVINAVLSLVNKTITDSNALSVLQQWLEIYLYVVYFDIYHAIMHWVVMSTDHRITPYLHINTKVKFTIIIKAVMKISIIMVESKDLGFICK